MVREIDSFSWEPQFLPSATANMLADLADRGETLGRTKRFYLVYDQRGDIIAEAGVALWAFTRPPELWIMIAKPFMRNLRESLHITREALELPKSQFHHLVAECYLQEHKSINFVKKLGFRPTGAISVRPNGQNFIQFEVV